MSGCFFAGANAFVIAGRAGMTVVVRTSRVFLVLRAAAAGRATPCRLRRVAASMLRLEKSKVTSAVASILFIRTRETRRGYTGGLARAVTASPAGATGQRTLSPPHGWSVKLFFRHRTMRHTLLTSYRQLT